MGRKFYQAAACKGTGLVLDLLGDESAPEWDKAGDEHYRLAKKHAVRDFTAAVSLMTMAIVLNSEEKISQLTEAQGLAEQGPGFISNWVIPSLKFAGYAVGSGITSGSIIAFALYYSTKMALNNPQHAAHMHEGLKMFINKPNTGST
jgi:hypothetical protein